MRLLVAIVLLLVSISTSRAASVEELAKGEGEVVFYSSLNNEQIVTFRDALQKKYPAIERNH